MKNSKKEILVVDYCEMIRNFHSYIIKMFGYEVATAENGNGLHLVKPTDYRKLVKTIKMLL